MVWLVEFWFSLGLAALASSLWIPQAHAGNTTCASDQLDWYTIIVGESPCATYQRLRRICDPDYEVPNFHPHPPGDQCDDQVSSCCCNTVAFELSMLCMNCQYNTVEDPGIDAPAGSYTLYRGACGAGTNHSLSANVQTAACNDNIRLDDFLYDGWTDGSWFYTYTKENVFKNQAGKNIDTATYCATTATALHTGNTVFQFTTASDTPTPTPGRDSSSGVASGNHAARTGAIVGGCVGAVAVLGGLFMFFKSRRNCQSRTHLIRHTSYPSRIMSPILPSTSNEALLTQSESLRPVSLHHEDAQLCRSASGRLPPAYRSWDNEESMEVLRTRDTQVSGPPAYHIASGTRRERKLPLTPTATHDHVPNPSPAPLRKAPAEKGHASR